MKVDRVELKIAEIPADLRERAELLARRAKVVITQCVPIPCREAPVGKVIIQMSPTIKGRLLIGYNDNRPDWEALHALLNTEPHLKPLNFTNVGTRRK